VRAWWKAKVDEIYRAIPDFGGFLVKANSEGQPGPHDYQRTHAEGANLFAEALAPHGGLLLWRAFVYAADDKLDRVRRLTGSSILTTVSRQCHPADQNGPLDFMPREPFHRSWAPCRAPGCD
jgi:alpha-glucuronidase